MNLRIFLYWELKRTTAQLRSILNTVFLLSWCHAFFKKFFYCQNAFPSVMLFIFLFSNATVFPCVKLWLFLLSRCYTYMHFFSSYFNITSKNKSCYVLLHPAKRFPVKLNHWQFHSLLNYFYSHFTYCNIYTYWHILNIQTNL